MAIKRRFLTDAGTRFTSKQNLKELNDQGGQSVEMPRSSYTIRESVNYTFTNRIMEGVGRRLSIADGEVRPGTTR